MIKAELNALLRTAFLPSYYDGAPHLTEDEFTKCVFVIRELCEGYLSERTRFARWDNHWALLEEPGNTSKEVPDAAWLDEQMNGQMVWDFCCAMEDVKAILAKSPTPS